MTTRIVVLCLGFALISAAFIGCGGRKEQTLKDRALADMPEDVDPVAHLVGDVEAAPVEEEQQERPSEVAAAPVESDGSDEIGGAQGAFVATITVLGKTVDGKIRVLTATDNPRVVEEDVGTGQEIRLDPGLYDFEFTTDAIAGGIKKTLSGVEIYAGRRIKRELKYPAGRLTLVTGGRCAKSPIRIKEKGATDWIPGKYYTCQELILPAGYYEAERGTTPISGIQVYDGGIQQVMIRQQ